MAECWARSLGDCNGKLSGEHLVSRALWAGSAIDVVGLPWCADEPKTIGIASLTANILCEGHNSRLSPTDVAAKDAFTAFQESDLIQAKRRKLTPRKWRLIRLEIDGPLFERWLIKTTLNLCTISKATDVWELNGQSINTAPDELVRAAFGAAALRPPLGLYAAASVGEDVNTSDHVTFATVLRENRAIVGAAFTFRGYRFFLRLTDGDLPLRLTLAHGKEQAWEQSALVYHLRLYRWKMGKKLSHYCHVMWPGVRVSPLRILTGA